MEKVKSKRELILDIAETGILSKGFGATSIDEIIAEAEITKSGFFYHFKDKNELARALLQRYLDTEEALLDDVFTRARELHGDPLHSLPDRAEDAVGDDGRPAERPSRLPRRDGGLFRAHVRPGRPDAEPAGHPDLARALPRHASGDRGDLSAARRCRPAERSPT